MTFSIAARCPISGRFGVAIASSSPAVAARCAFARVGTGAVCTQNVTNPALGPLVLDLMASGASAPAAVASAIGFERFPEFRQLLAIDRAGATAVHSGARALGVWSSDQGADCVAGGNLLAHHGVPAAMVAGFEIAEGALGDRLMAAMRAAVTAGGEAGPVHSAGLLIVDEQPWPYAELRIDWLDDECPIEALARAWTVYGPQADDYVTRAVDPTRAPSYGVPGDE